MPITEDDWEQAHEEADHLTTLHKALVKHYPEAIYVSDLLRDAGPAGSGEHGLLGSFTEAI